MAKKDDKAKEQQEPAKASKQEQVGFHKGSLMTLSKERQELVRIVGIVEQLMQMHATALTELGVPLDQTGNQPSAPQAPAKKRPPIEDIL